jgi:hypothetical protein
MIQLLFFVLFAEGFVASLLLVKIGPLRDLVIKSLDQVKMGKGPATVKTIAGTMSVILFSSLMSIVKIQNKGAKLGTMSPMDQVLWRTHLLEASLMGTILFFSLGPFVCLLLCFLLSASFVVLDDAVLDGNLWFAIISSDSSEIKRKLHSFLGVNELNLYQVCALSDYLTIFQCFHKHIRKRYNQ